MRVLVVENYEKTPPGVLSVALAEANAEVDLRRAFAGDAVPASHDGHDAIVILGGGQNALDDSDSPWLPRLAALAREFGEAGKAVLGVCLGAQLVARGYGARNILGRPIEFGWHEVVATDAGRADPLVGALGAASPIFHWHEDTFTLPPGAVHLASSAMTDIQAFRVGDNVYGIQFHFEADRGLVASWSVDFAAQIAGYAPDWPARMPGEAARHGPEADRTGLAIARAFVRLAAARAYRQPEKARLDLAGVNQGREQVR